MEFVIRDGDWYVMRENGKFDKTKDIVEALRFSSEEKCNNTIKNCFSKNFKNEYAWRSFQIPELKIEMPQEIELKREQTVYLVKTPDGYFGLQGNKPVFNVCMEDAFQFTRVENCNRILQLLIFFGKEGVVKQEEKPWNKDLNKSKQFRVATQYQAEQSQLDAFMLQLVTMYTVLEEQYATLQEQYAQSEAKVVDYYHAIEFYDLNAADGFCLYRGLKQVLRERRKLKNDMKKSAVLRRTCLDPERIEQLQKSFPVTNKFEYVPRVLTSIFEGRN